MQEHIVPLPQETIWSGGWVGLWEGRDISTRVDDNKKNMWVVILCKWLY